MLFNSYEFIFLFLPFSLLGFWAIITFRNTSLVTGWLIFISLLFYAIWSPKFLLLLLFSITVNWLFGHTIHRFGLKNISNQPGMPKILKFLLIVGISFNLFLLGYFKYTNFFIDTINSLGSSLEPLHNLILPLGISFYTFEQISYLVGVATGKGKHYDFPRFLLFVLFFPHLIAGPILSVEELIPQFCQENYRLDVRNLSIGFTVFSIGLFKKAVMADAIAGYASSIFDFAEIGQPLGFILAWQGAIAYSLQLYFDFSGYSDMAIGLAKLFNIDLPMNFFSPYKAIGIGDFWRRWHITLSRFLRDYLYIPLGGSRQGKQRQYINLVITMLLGGFWHGANWTFILWGLLHGTYLVIDRVWQQFQQTYRLELEGFWHRTAARSLTLLAIIVSWVLFRSQNLTVAGNILSGMLGFSGFLLPEEKLMSKFHFLTSMGVKFVPDYPFIGIRGTLEMLLMIAIVLFIPNVYQFMSRESISIDVYKHLQNQTTAWWAWKPTYLYGIMVGAIFFAAIYSFNKPSEFLYFQF
jgi:D-alanyl-lipoteichoic acid acyltransferase DltB (MBOAT superfamily)